MWGKPSANHNHSRPRWTKATKCGRRTRRSQAAILGQIGRAEQQEQAVELLRSLTPGERLEKDRRVVREKQQHGGTQSNKGRLKDQVERWRR